MKKKLVYVERKASEFVSIERIFRSVANRLSDDFDHEFQQAPFGSRFQHVIGNLLFFRKRKADLYHITGHVHYLAMLLPPRCTILTIHDVGFLYTPPGFRWWLKKKVFLDWPVKRLRFITAVSERTKREIIRFTGCAEDKITVVENPLFIDAKPTRGEHFNSARPVILQVGTATNKNVPNLARALRGINCKFRIIGRMDEETIAALADNGIDFENGLELTDEQMSDEYQAADIVTYCSIYEGFGLPIIEAQASGKPVVTSNVEPLIETAGGAAVLVDPNDVVNIKEGIEKVIADPDLRKSLVDAGLTNSARFAPATIARRYELYYRKVLEAGSEMA